MSFSDGSKGTHGMSIGLKADSNDRYQRFLKRILEQGFVYSFLGDGQLKAWDANELAFEDGTPVPLITIWSNEAYPKAWLPEFAEQGYKLIQIPLDGVHPLLDDLEKNGFGIGAEWNQQGFGVELSSSQFRDDVTELITKQYGAE